MQLRTLLLALLILAAFAARATANDPSSMKRNLLELSGLKEGGIELIDGNEDCTASTLRILEIDEDDHFTLTISLGAQPLIMGLGVQNTKSKERGCEILETATVGHRKVGYKKTQSCGKRGEFEYLTNITVDEAGFEYTKTNSKILNKELGKKETTLTRTCKYRFVQ
jgi:hypothetical protein